MSLIPPSLQCPQTACYEVVQVCWSDGSGNVTGCHVVPASALTGKGATITLQDVVAISGAFALLMATAWLVRYVANFLHYQGR